MSICSLPEIQIPGLISGFLRYWLGIVHRWRYVKADQCGWRPGLVLKYLLQAPFLEDLFSSLWYCFGKYSTIGRKVLTGTCKTLILKPDTWFYVLSASLFCYDVRNLRFTVPLLFLPYHATLKFS